MTTFAEIAALKPLAYIDGRPLITVIQELNTAIEGAGVEFGEYDFGSGLLRGSEVFENYRWVTAAAVQGSNEGYYVNLTVSPARHDREPSRLISSAKTWDWESALVIAAAATRLLSDQ